MLSIKSIEKLLPCRLFFFKDNEILINKFLRKLLTREPSDWEIRSIISKVKLKSIIAVWCLVKSNQTVRTKTECELLFH